jgi:hypothetical protein
MGIGKDSFNFFGEEAFVVRQHLLGFGFFRNGGAETIENIVRDVFEAGKDF